MTDVVTAPDSLQPATIDFSALMAKAMAHPAGNDTEPPVQPSITPTPEPVSVTAEPAPTPPEGTPMAAPPPVEAKILDLPEDGQVRVKIDGKETLVSVKEYRDGISREAVFTKRMQTLAEQRAQAEAKVAADLAAVRAQQVAVEQMRRDLLARMTQPPAAPAQVAPAAPDPGELATMGDVQSTLQAAMAHLEQQYKERDAQFVAALGQATQKVQTDAEVARDAAAYTTGLKSILSQPDYKVLADALPYAEESIRYQVAAMDPQSMDEAISFTEQVAKEWTQKLRAQFVDAQQRHEVAKAQAKLEAPVGSPPPPALGSTPKSAFGKDGKIDWQALHNRAAALING